SAGVGQTCSAPVRPIRPRDMPRPPNNWPRCRCAGEIVMGILTSILSSANALKVFDQEFSTIQNNIANANTPGYAEQSVTLSADSFNPSEGLDGGVSTGPLASSRSQYLEQSVRTQTTLLGAAQQQVSDLSPLQSLFDLSSATGISGSLDSFFNSF